MTGLIWFVQVVHYPMFARVGRDSWESYHRRHMSLTTIVVLPAMLIEAATGIWLCYAGANLPHLWLLGMLAGVWLSTFLIQVPIHNQLAVRFDHGLVRRLVRTNWIRTALWTGRATVLFLTMS